MSMWRPSPCPVQQWQLLSENAMCNVISLACDLVMAVHLQGVSSHHATGFALGAYA